MKFIKNEINHFRSLPQKARDLLISYLYFGATNPLILTFINAFIWRKQGDIESLAFYNIGNTIILPIIFYFNGYLLKKIKSTYLYFFGALFTAIAPITIVFFPISKSWHYLIFGSLFGVGYGIYWANRNYFTFKETASHNRNYFLGLNFSLRTLAGILVPAVIGWFIFLIPKYGYQISIVTALILLFFSGKKIVNDNFDGPVVKNISLQKATSSWWAIRGLVTSIGIIEGVSLFLPTLLILTKIGSENILGSLNSFINLIIAVLIYYYGRKAHVRHQKPVLFATVIIGFLAALIFGWQFSVSTTVLYIAVNYLAIEFMWLTSGPIIMDVMDKEKMGTVQNVYPLIYDQELFLDIGRLISFGILFLLIYSFGQSNALRFSPLFVYLVQIILVLYSTNKLSRSRKV
jgi:YQGE family putative transporter